MRHLTRMLIGSVWLALHLSLATSGAQTLDTVQRHTAAPDQPVTLRVLTYNIKRGLGNDGQTDLARTANRIAELKPDLVGLQEVDQGCRRSGNIDQPAQLEKRLRMKSAFGPFMKFDGGLYGLATLSQFPIVKTTNIQLPDGNEPRVALATQVRLPTDETMLIVNIHFDWVRDDGFRFAQAKAVKQFLDRLEEPYLLLGDFNDQPKSRTLQLFSKTLLEMDKPEEDRFTFSATQPKSEIDFIFASPPDRWNILSVQVVDEPVVSDHRPVIAKIRLLPKR